MAADSLIPPPSFPLVVTLNQAVTDFLFARWVKQNLVPLGYDVVITGREREADHNAEVGGASNSAHLHGLAVDFKLIKNGVPVPPAVAHQVYQSVVVPTWLGYAQDEIDSKNHIHVNLTREITPTMTVATATVLGLLGFQLWRVFTDHKPG